MHALVVVSNAIRIISHSLSCLLAYTYHNKLTIPLPNRIVQKKKRLHQPFFLLYTLFEDSDSNVYLLSMCLPLLPTYLKPLHLLVELPKHRKVLAYIYKYIYIYIFFSYKSKFYIFCYDMIEHS